VPLYPAAHGDAAAEDGLSEGYRDGASGRAAGRQAGRIGRLHVRVGDAGITISRSVNVPVTTGDSYTVVSAVEAMKKAAEIMGIDLPGATLAVVGATGAIGR